MPTSVDELQIELNAQSVKANDAVDKLIAKLDRLTSSLEKVNGSAINGLANSVEKLGKSMQIVNNVKTSDFTRLTRNIEKLSAINTSTLNSSASAINILSKSVNSLGNVSQSAQQIGTLASNLSKLGYKSIATATQNIPQLANAIKQLMVTLSTAPRVNYNIVQMTNALANLAGQLKGVKANTTTSTTWFGNLSKSMNTATRSSFSLVSAFGKFYATYFLVIRAIKGLWSSIKDTSDYIESFNYFNVAFGKIASEWRNDWQKYGYQNADDYTESFTKHIQESMAKLSGVKVEIDEDGLGLLTSSGMKNLGLNIQEITQYASQLASVTNSLGQTGEVSQAIANSFTKLAGDISSLFNVDYNAVAENLQSGLIGQSRALYKYGIDITNATLQTYAYELGLEKTVIEMTQMEKQQLRVLAILDQSKVSWGDLANTINSPSNMIRQLTNNLKEAGMVLGQLFMPALSKILPVLNGLSIAIKNLLVDFAGLLGIKIDFSSFGQGYSELEEDLDGVTDGFDDATESANKLKKSLRGFDKLNLISTGTTGITSSLASSIDLTEQIKKATEEYEKLWEQAYAKMESQAHDFAEKIGKALAPIKVIFEDFVVGDYFKAGEDISNLVIGINEFLTKAIKNVDWEQIGENIGDFLAGVDWTGILESFGELFWEAINAGIELWKSSFDAAPVETTIVTGLAALKFTGVGGILLGNLGASLVNGLKSTFSFAFSNPTTFVGMFSGTPAFDVVGVEILGSIEKAMEEALPDWVNNLIGNIVAGLTVGAVGGSWLPGLGTFAGAVIGGIIGAFNGIEINGESVLLTISKKLFNFDSASAWFDEAIKSFETAFDGKRQNWLDIGGYIFEGIVEGLVAGLTFVTEPFTDLFWWCWDGICNVFGINSPADEMKPLGEYILEGIVEGFSDSFSEFDASITNFWEEYVKPWFSRDKWTFSGVETGLKTAWENAIKGIKEIWNKFAKTINDKLTFKIDPIEIMGKTIFKGVTLNFGKIPTFQTGGFPEDGLFLANHNELVGKFSNGQTAVANNEQIVGGIKQGVKEAVSEILAPYLADIADSSRKTANKSFGITSRDAFNAVRSETKDFANRNGYNPLLV